MKSITGDQPDHGRELQKVKYNVCHLSKLAVPLKPAQVLCRGKLRRVQREKGWGALGRDVRLHDSRDQLAKQSEGVRAQWKRFRGKFCIEALFQAIYVSPANAVRTKMKKMHQTYIKICNNWKGKQLIWSKIRKNRSAWDRTLLLWV